MAKSINYDVPFFSQRLDILDESWRYRSCGIIATKMAMDYWHGQSVNNSSPTLEVIIGTGLTIGAYSAGIGWSHAGLANIGRQFGYDGYSQDLAGLDLELAWSYLLDDLKRFPVIASIYPRFDPSNKDGHIVVLTGFDGELVFYNDPDEHSEREGKKAIAIERFLRGWKKRYIVIHPLYIKKSMKTKPTDQVEFLMFDTYMAFIKNSAGSPIFRDVFVKINGKKTNATDHGKTACAVFVSNILLLFSEFGLIKKAHSMIAGTLTDMESCGWEKTSDPRVGCVILWEERERNGESNKHLGFYLGNNEAISNSPDLGVPEVHHWTFGMRDGQPVRKVEAMYWHKRLEE